MSKACIKLEVRGVCVGLRRHTRRADRGTACPLSLRVHVQLVLLECTA